MLLGTVKFNAGTNNGNYFSPNYFLTGGYRFFLTDEVSVLPSVMIQYLQPQLYGLHSNVKLQYLDKLWVGGSYQFSDLISGYSAMAGFNVSNTFNISYAYENTIGSQLKIFTKNTHEIVLGFLLGNKYGDFCPRNVW
jgi:type IX secretion system PorP/SprF family membrane protein